MTDKDIANATTKQKAKQNDGKKSQQSIKCIIQSMAL
jgi:hypothetical protein